MADTDPDTASDTVVDTGGPSPDMAKAEELATEPGALVRGRFTLIGTMGTDDLRRALVMTRGGDVVQVGVGDNLGGARVDAIAPDHLLMSRNGRRQVLEMPRG